MIISEEILKESSTYQYLIEKGVAQGVAQGVAKGMAKGVAQGLEEGRAKGLAEGRLAARREDLGRLLTRRFGPLSTATQRKLDAAPIEKLDRWFDRALDAASLKDALK